MKMTFMNVSESYLGSDKDLVPCLNTLVRKVQTITPDVLVLSLLTLFHRHEDLFAVPLLDAEQKYVGLVYRRPFMSFITRSFVREVYSHKPVSEVIKAVPEIAMAPLCPSPNDRIDETLMKYLARDPSMFYDALPVVERDYIVGIVAISDIMLSLSETQKKLIDTVHTLSNRLKEEVILAAQLQRQLLPPKEINLSGVHGIATVFTSSEVGGDYYDCYTVDGRYDVFMVGDVSGHGVASGMLVSAVKASVNLLESDREYLPERILKRLNLTLLNTARQALYMTLFVACLDTSTGELLYCNAGHQFPYLYRIMLGSLETLEIGGLPLGKSEQAKYITQRTEIDLGDRLILYTDGIIEELNDRQEEFGYDRFEWLLRSNIERSFEEFRDVLFSALSEHTGLEYFQDDVTLFMVKYETRTVSSVNIPEISCDYPEQSLVRLPDAWYRARKEPLSPYIPRQTLVLLTESSFSDILPQLSQDGIRRVLPRHQPILQRLGWELLIHQHQYTSNSDLAALISRTLVTWRDMPITHSDDKSFVIDECIGCLEESGISQEYLEVAMLVIDEMLENGLYGAPRNGKGGPLYAKGQARSLDPDEMLSLHIAVGNGVLGLSVIDTWGTLTPAVFLQRLSRHIEGNGLIPGRGGAGFYLLWRLSDYLQLRVLPNRQTQVTVLFDFNRPLNPNIDKGFQFLFHSEMHEATSYVSSHLACPTRNSASF